MAQYPMLPLWTDSYLGDTTHLSTIEHGAYLLLLITAWRSKGCKLPDNDELLARYTRLGRAQWMRIRKVMEPFFRIADGFWIQGRLMDEHVAVERQRDHNIAAGRASALKRQGRHSTAVGTPVQPKSNPPTPTPTPTPKEQDSPPKLELFPPPSAAVAAKTGKDAKTDHPDFPEWYAAYPKHEARAAASKAYFAARKKTDAAALLDAAKRYAAKKEGEDKKYTKQPATWLNAECWRDDDETVPVNSLQTQEQRHEWLITYARDGRWVRNDGNGVWKDFYAVGAPPHDPRTLVTDTDLDAVAGARAMRERMRAAA